MPEDQRFTHLVGSIYDAALNSALWVDALAKIADFVGGQAAGLLSKDPVRRSSNVYHHVGVLPHYVQLYAETYCKFDPMMMLSFSKIEQIVSISDLVPLDEFREGRFYREWMRPQGWVDAAKAVLERTATNCAYINIVRSEARGMVDDEMRRRMRLIAPHARRAMLVGKAIDLRQAEAATFTDTLDGLSAGLFLVDADGRIVHANAAGHGILGAGDFLRSIGGRLVAGDAQVDQTLRESFAAAGSGDAGIGIKGIALPLTAHDGECYVAHVLPLTSGARRRAGKAYTAAAALFVRKAALETPSPPEVIGRTYNLTPTELRVLLAIVEVGGVPEVAAALGVADSTIKAHLGSLFEKTGAGRQADLVKLVAGFSTLLAG